MSNITNPEHAQKIPLLEFAGNPAGWLTVKEAAPYMGYDRVKTVRDMCAAREIECLQQPGGRFMIHRDTIKGWLRSHMSTELASGEIVSGRSR